MKKIFIILIGVFLCTSLMAQKKITDLGTATSATAGSITYIRQGASGDIVRTISIANLLATPHTQAQSTITALPDSLLNRYTKAQANALFGAGGYTNLTSFINQTAWRVFYSDGSGDVKELALGADGTYLKSNGASAAPTFDTPAGSGDVMQSDSTDVFATPKQIADSLNAFRSNMEIGSTFYSLLAPDTVQHTANYTVASTDWAKDQHLNKATSIVVTIPADLTEWPVGGVMNFYSFGAGISVFKKGAGVVFVSDLDSIATSRGKQDVSIKKVATNKYKLTGPLTD